MVWAVWIYLWSETDFSSWLADYWWLVLAFIAIDVFVRSVIMAILKLKWPDRYPRRKYRR